MYIAPNRVFLGLGTNLGDRLKNLQDAARSISNINGVEFLKSSAVIETEAWGKKDQPDFLNVAVEIQCTLEADELFDQLQLIEQRMGRVCEEKWGPRIIDIDILFFNDECVNTDRMVIPHAEMQNRKFVLENLCDIAPRLFHPVLKCTVSELRMESKDDSRVTKFGKLVI